MMRIVQVVLVLLVATNVARGEFWAPSADGQVVERAEVIAVARIKPGTIEYVPHKAKIQAHGLSWEHHVTIVVGRTLKGSLAMGEHRVIVHYGLTPCVGGRWEREGGLMNLPDRPRDVVEIVGGGMGVSWGKPDDMRQDHVLLLRRARAGGPQANGKEMLGIMDIQDIQPLARLDYLRLYTLKDPEPDLRRYVQKHPEDAVRALPYFHHRAVQRAIADPDPARRVERLLPYFASYVLYGYRDEAGEAIEAVGEPAVPYLIALLDDSGLYSSRRTEVILKLGRIGSKRATPSLVALVKRNRSWLSGVGKDGVFDEKTLGLPAVCRRLHDMASAIYSLGLIGDRSVIDVIRRVHATYKRVLAADHALMRHCRVSLEKLDRAGS